MNRFNLECNKVKNFDLSKFIDAWTNKKDSTQTKFVPLKAQWVCEEWIRSYATEAQENMNEAFNNEDLKSWRYWRYVRCSAFAIMYKDNPKKKECYEEETQRWMAARIDSTLEIFTR